MKATEPLATMPTAELKWQLKPVPADGEINDLVSRLGVNEIIARLLIQRGITRTDEAKKFFEPSLSDLHDPFRMKDMDKAVTRIEKAVAANEKILVYGDYDVDGTTAVALFYTFLKSLGANCGYYIPDRYAEGYGVSFAGIDYAHANGYSLIVALDCGIKANDKVSYANEKRIDFIICDHHRPGAELPDAAAVLDPKRDDCRYPYDELCGCGIGFKLAQAITQKRGQGIETILPLLDLVAIAIAADIVPLTGENRILTTFGLKRINESPRTGIKAMLQLANIKRKINISDIVFIFAPRINAAGRIEHGKAAVQLLASTDETEAMTAAELVNKNNNDRRDIDKTITAEALEKIAASTEEPTKKSTVVFDPSWHKGVVGIVASRLIDKYYRPTVVLTQANGKVTGSARSVKDFDIYEAIEACSDLLLQFGGHKYAAGLTMEPDNVEAFIQKFEKVVSSAIGERKLVPELEIDAEISLQQITPELLNSLRAFGPFGPGNMNPVFLTKNVCDRGWAKIVGENHLKFDLLEPADPSRFFPAIGFGLSGFLSNLSYRKEVNACYTIEDNEWNGKVTIQLNVKDLKS
ncbi:MAG TPA: single-stranded-DNA-specific exonuclease RecJ [Bacteroidia bacterium]|nr:single-stranded-DNA-specific exonuclease RecJ [Bacteroidia bacterium]